MSEDVTVDRNTISGSPRACLNIEDGTWGGDNIENNALYDCVTGTGDNGAINVWGRDRWWAANGNNQLAAGTAFDGDTGEPLTDAQAKQMMLLDTIKPIVIQHNLIEQAGSSWSVDFDDGSSNFDDEAPQRLRAMSANPCGRNDCAIPGAGPRSATHPSSVQAAAPGVGLLR